VWFVLDNGQKISWLNDRQFASNPCGSHPVGLKQANAWGLYDMLGNVYEWVADPWHGDYKDAPEDGKVWQEEGLGESDELRRVVRGGSWLGRAGLCRSAFRGRLEPVSRFDLAGFRCVRVQV
ncbi:MAG: formylglycine-generating enzyme family protein, partial [Candidatus Electrothrix sp. AR3]|nr:formylglycine-generating enzyme family protein [Candidatus Electrothrix sp. AR3]